MKMLVKPNHKSLFSRLLLVTINVLCSILPVTAEIREFHQLLKADETSIWATDGYLRAPGYIDISGLTFEAVGDAFGIMGDDAFADGDDMTYGDGNGGGRQQKAKRRLWSRHWFQQRRQSYEEEAGREYEGGELELLDHDPRDLDGGVEVDSFVLDVAVFQQPDKCAKRNNCNWPALGVGAEQDEGKTLRWCCSRDAINSGMCTEDQLGRLILHDSIFAGEHRFINVPYSGEMKKQLKHGNFKQDNSGRYVVVLANCNQQGRDVMVRGQSVWKSVHGYLPGELFGFMNFYLAMAVIYVLLALWFGCLMQANKESRIPIEKWIFMTILMGLSEMVLRSFAYIKLNVNGIRPVFLIYSYIIVGVLKRGISRGLMVMVSLGWGVIRDSLGSTINSIMVLTACYIGVSAFADLTEEFAIEDVRNLSDDSEDKLINVVTVLTFFVAAIDVVFILWILDALNGTMEYLENMNQLRKLARYLRLRSILLFAILFSTIWIVFLLVDTYNEDPIVMEEHAWVVDAATEINYLYVLIGISLLWRPNPSAREYAYVMELPATRGGDDEENELELGGVVPSAMDDDGDEPNGGKTPKEGARYHDHDERFAIDEGEAA